jgi:hypothetical protein
VDQVRQMALVTLGLQMAGELKSGYGEAEHAQETEIDLFTGGGIFFMSERR